MPVSVKLLPCAHCGDTNIKLLRRFHDDNVYWHVECTECGMSTMEYPEDCGGIACEHATVEEMMDCAIDCAVSTWNSRVNVKDDVVVTKEDGKIRFSSTTKPEKGNIILNMENMSNEDLVKVSKMAIDVLTNKASKIIDDITDAWHNSMEKVVGDNNG